MAQNGKRVLIVTQYFYPESFRINELGYELVKRGYHVDALVGLPNYPQGRYYKGYGIFGKRYEKVKGVGIYRVFQFARGRKASNLQLSINYLSYVLSAYLWILFFFIFKKKYDAIIGFQMSPITQVLPGILLKKLKGGKLITWVQDIWPDSVTDNTSERQSRLIIPILSKITEYVYRNSDKLLITSVGMEKLICRQADYHNKIEYVPNWCDDFYGGERTEDILAPEGFNLMMAGNLGEGIGPDDMIALAEELKDLSDLNVTFVGGGSRLEYMKEQSDIHKLRNIHFWGSFPYSKMGSVYAYADAMLLALKPSAREHLNVTVPSRLQAYMSAGKPVFAMIGSGAASVIEESDCGFVAPAGNYKMLAQHIRDNYKNSALLKQKGENARNAFLKHFTLKTGVDHFEELINSERVGFHQNNSNQ